MPAPTVASHSAQLRLTIEGLFWNVPQMSAAYCSTAQQSLSQSLELYKSRKCLPPVSAVKNASHYTKVLELKALRFSSHSYPASTELEDASWWQRCRARVCPPQAGRDRTGTSGHMPQRVWGRERQCPEYDDRSGPYQYGWCGTSF